MLIQPRRRRVQFLQQIRTHLPAGAPVLLSFFARHNDARHFRIVARIANVFRRMLGREKVMVGDDLMPNFVHHFTQQEIAAELSEGGFELVEYSTAEYPHATARATRASR
jgi:hypothetical protein